MESTIDATTTPLSILFLAVAYFSAWASINDLNRRFPGCSQTPLPRPHKISKSLGWNSSGNFIGFELVQAATNSRSADCCDWIIMMLVVYWLDGDNVPCAFVLFWLLSGAICELDDCRSSVLSIFRFAAADCHSDLPMQETWFAIPSLSCSWDRVYRLVQSITTSKSDITTGAVPGTLFILHSYPYYLHNFL